jgi:signal transduction histidine kinase
VAICAGELKKKVKSVDIEVSDDLPGVFTDPGAVEQILINLLINAIQATDKEDSWIRVRALLAPSGTDYVQIEVSDNGCGMDENTMDQIFEPFYTTKPPGTGTGLGLYVTQNLIHELGGDISVESQPGVGSIFTIHIPVQRPAEGRLLIRYLNSVMAPAKACGSTGRLRANIPQKGPSATGRAVVSCRDRGVK